MLSPSESTFRLRGCPATADKIAVRDALAREFDIEPTDIHIQSLAKDVNISDTSSTKTATLRFSKLPSVIQTQHEVSQKEWKIEAPGFDSAILDMHFLGLTPLNDVEIHNHGYDCVAISGLSSHPFGSWQPKSDRSQMWIRDSLPKALPHIRTFLFGYDTRLPNSISFQSVADLGCFLSESLRAAGFASKTRSKPLLFLAHSLGGIVLKEALYRDRQITNHSAGVIFFGVPSRGMQTQALMTMVHGQPNQDLVRDLTVGSQYLQHLDDRLFEVARVGRMEMFWAYETKTSPTVIKLEDESFYRAGPEEILVTPESATRGLYGTNSTSIFGINENHSNMVKFSKGDANYPIVLGKLKDICASHYEVSRP
ncbi:hypothetical protein QBC34DRAFT_278713, partial [Podospora aff. communis PSN243]